MDLQEVKSLIHKISHLNEALTKMGSHVSSEVKKEVSKAPEHEGVIKRYDNSFVISSKHLSNECWIPSFYDSKLLAEYTCEEIDKKKGVFSVVAFLQKIVDTGYIERTNPKNLVKVSPLFREHIKSIIQEVSQ